MANKSQIIQALDSWIRQRPGLEFGNYGDVSAYRSEMRSIGKDLHHARTMLRYVEWHDSITAEMIFDCAKSGRLSIVVDGDKVSIDYCTGQYWPTEYRLAVCRLLSSVIWHWMRENAPVDAGPIDKFSNLQNVGPWIRKQAAREFGRSIARKWFA